MRSQRHCSDIGRAEANAAEAARLAQVKEEEKQNALWHRSSEKAEIKRLEEELKVVQGPSLHGLSSKIGKISGKGGRFYEHVQFGYDWLKRFDIQDIPPLIVAVLKKIGRERNEDLCWKTIMDNGMASARDALLDEHEKEISKHLTVERVGRGRGALPPFAIAGLLQEAPKKIITERPRARAQDHGAPMPAEAAQLTYSQRVGAAFVAFIQFYAYLKQDHGVFASELSPEKRAERGHCRRTRTHHATCNARTHRHQPATHVRARPSLRHLQCTNSTCSSASRGTARPRGTSTPTRT